MKYSFEDVFKTSASALDTLEGKKAYASIMEGANKVILKTVPDISVMRNLFTPETLPMGTQPSYPLPIEGRGPVWILPIMGDVAHDFLQPMAQSVSIDTFTIATSKEWLLRYAEEGRLNIVQQATMMVAQDIADFEEECGWKVIIPAVTSSFSGGANLTPRRAPIMELPPGDPSAGFFSPALINKLILHMKRLKRTLTELWVSPEDLADIREWSDIEVDPITRNGIFKAGGMTELWGVRFRELSNLGVRGLYNINDKDSEFGFFTGDQLSNSYNDYTITHGNVVDLDGNLKIAGETQIYGFDTTNKLSLVMPIKRPFRVYPDPALLRSQMQGFFGWQEIGMACLETRDLCMGVIDRYTPGP